MPWWPEILHEFCVTSHTKAEGIMHCPNAIHDTIPFLDLITPHRELEEELVTVFRRVLHTAGFVGGKMVEDFENAFADFCGVSHAVGVNSGTDALRFAIIASGIRPGDAVITVPNTFIATTEAISQAGALPEFVGIDDMTYNMSVESLREFLEHHCSRDSRGRLISMRSGRPVTAVIPVHLYGQMANMDPILELAATYNLVVIEDACQAHGAEYYSCKLGRWFKAGSMGSASAFSFYPGKNLGACGEGGAITTNDPALAKAARMLRDHGQSRKYYHDIEGYNGRLDAIQTGILSVKLKHLEHWNAQRREAAERYRGLFIAAGLHGLPPCEPDWAKSVYHLYVVRVSDRDSFIRFLASAGIGTGIHYPVPLHLQKAYEGLGYHPGSFWIAERAAEEIVSLPMFPGLTMSQQEQVVEAVASAVFALQAV
jgi:dTDP-4-amino-4,6-dideoxygalactose transaminase